MLNMASKNRLIDNFLTSNEQYCTYTCMSNLRLLCNLLLFFKAFDTSILLLILGTF